MAARFSPKFPVWFLYGDIPTRKVGASRLSGRSLLHD